MICPFCGKEITSNTKFCTSCGKKFPDSSNQEILENVQLQDSADTNRANEINTNSPRISKKNIILITLIVSITLICICITALWISGVFDDLLGRNQPAPYVHSRNYDDDETSQADRTTELSTKTATETSIITTDQQTRSFDVEIGGKTVWSGTAFLDLSYCDIYDITPLQSLTNLTVLILSDNEIRDITPLKSLKKLTVLIIGYNEINDISPLRSLTNLSYLDIRDNNIRDISPLSQLSNMTLLDISYNEINDITPLKSLIHLQELNISGNEINDVTPLMSLIHLDELSGLYNNPIDESQIDELRQALPNSNIYMSSSGGNATTTAAPAVTTTAAATTAAPQTTAAQTTAAATEATTAAPATTAAETTTRAR